jgi:hypothetical protein
MYWLSNLAALLFLASGGFQHPQPPEVATSRTAVIKLTLTPPDTCQAAVGGKSYVLPRDQQALLTALEIEKKRFKNARVDGDYNTVPYRCFGSAVFTAQQAGFKRVGFISQPPSEPSNH